MLAETLALRWDEQQFTEVRPGRPVPLGPGQLAVIPGDVPHSATVAPDGERVVTVNVWRLRRR